MSNVMQMQKVKQVILFLTILNLTGINASVTSPEEGMPTGPCCQVSPAGVPGIPGNHGPYGPAGSKGDMGSPGDVGMHGAKGDKGSDGLNGERGATGEPGQKGEQGVGQPGKQGPQGLPGIAGLMGGRGVPGLVGLKGQKGDCIERTQRVAFSVARNTDIAESTSSLPFEEILFEEGTHFDLSTGTFTCNVAGIYVFMFSVLKLQGSASAYATLMKNGNAIVRGFTSGAGNYLQTGSSAVVSLQEDDRVFLNTGGNLRSNSLHYTSFSGFLLYGEN